jgi:hypothetical protein
MGHPSTITGKGTFKEQWRLQWDPGFSIEIIEKGNLGNTVEEAASTYVSRQATDAKDLKAVAALLEDAIPAELPRAVEALITKINNLAAASGDVIQLMEVIPNLVTVSRYGSVRKTDAEIVMNIAESMIVRICVSLPAACSAVDAEAAEHLLDLSFKLNEAINTLQHQHITNQWQQTLKVIAFNKNTTSIIAGYTTRLLADRKLLAADELVKVFYYAMSSSAIASEAAAWLEGFLKGSGTILLIDHELWMVVDNWVKQLREDVFDQVLPLLRRTFSGFSNSERRKLGEKVKFGSKPLQSTIKTEADFDYERAKKGIPVIMRLMGYKTQSND